MNELLCHNENPRDLYNKSLQRLATNKKQTLDKSILLILCLEILTFGNIFWAFEITNATLILAVIASVLLSLTGIFMILNNTKFKITERTEKYNDIVILLGILIYFIIKVETLLSFQGNHLLYLTSGMVFLPLIQLSQRSITQVRIRLILLVLCIIYIFIREIASEDRNVVSILQVISVGFSSIYFSNNEDSTSYSLFVQNYILFKKEINTWQRVLKDVPEPTYLLDLDLKILFTNVIPQESEKYTIFADDEKGSNLTQEESIKQNAKASEIFKLIKRIEISENKDLAQQFFNSLSTTGTTNLDDSIGELLEDKLLRTRLKSPTSTLFNFPQIPTSKNEAETLGFLNKTNKISKKFKSWLRTQTLVQILEIISKNLGKFQKFFGKSQLILVGRIIEESSPISSLLNIQKSKVKDAPETNLVEIKISLTQFQKRDCFFIMVSNKVPTSLTSSLKSVNEYKINLLASFSHELRTPLNGNLNFLETALQRPDVSAEIKNDYLTPAFTSAKFLFYIISDILDYSQFSLDKMSLSIKRFKIQTLLEEVVSLFRIQATKKNIKINIDLEHNFEIATDFTRLCQVLVNLLSNAIKFTYEGGIRIGISEVSEPPNCYKIYVKDTGIGISAKQKKKLEKIFRGEDAERVSNQSVGSNLGLTTSSRLAILLGPAKNHGIMIEEQKKGLKLAFLIENKKLAHNDRSLLDLTLSGLMGGPNPFEGLGSPQEIKSLTFLNWKEKTDNAFAQLLFKRSVSSNEAHARELKSKLSNESQIVMTTPEEGTAEFVGKNSLTGGMARIKFNFNNPTLAISIPDKTRKMAYKSSLKDAPKCKCNTILIVDDDSFNLMAAEKLFRAVGLNSLSAFHGMQAIEIIESREACSESCELFKFILMDCNMPIMDGYETTQYLKKKMLIGELPQIPIVACTAFVTHFDSTKCFDSGMDDYVTKPLSKEKINRILEKWNRIKTSTQVFSPGLRHSGNIKRNE